MSITAHRRRSLILIGIDYSATWTGCERGCVGDVNTRMQTIVTILAIPTQSIHPFPAKVSNKHVQER